jgi:hypothetical protein
VVDAHVILNHFPTIGSGRARGHVGADPGQYRPQARGPVPVRICAILTVPTYVTGNASMWAVTDPGAFQR